MEYYTTVDMNTLQLHKTTRMNLSMTYHPMIPILETKPYNTLLRYKWMCNKTLKVKAIILQLKAT